MLRILIVKKRILFISMLEKRILFISMLKNYKPVLVKIGFYFEEFQDLYAFFHAEPVLSPDLCAQLKHHL